MNIKVGSRGGHTTVLEGENGEVIQRGIGTGEKRRVSRLSFYAKTRVSKGEGGHEDFGSAKW